ncbi:hypothetical protein TNCV_3784671 [Trichonephila clavipes]|uniref:Uncharacterized protein n=1 Tax=Trichonephila clavipes TaxID=2585209 RepID=A0A8X6UPG9_TRICX|nr:hypothetical protein TNCV_3784671 [Trichonephila clavipes]
MYEEGDAMMRQKTGQSIQNMTKLHMGLCLRTRTCWGISPSRRCLCVKRTSVTNARVESKRTSCLLRNGSAAQ